MLKQGGSRLLQEPKVMDSRQPMGGATIVSGVPELMIMKSTPEAGTKSQQNPENTKK